MHMARESLERGLFLELDDAISCSGGVVVRLGVLFAPGIEILAFGDNQGPRRRWAYRCVKSWLGRHRSIVNETPKTGCRQIEPRYRDCTATTK